jgi:DNA repair ATPase RecN
MLKQLILTNFQKHSKLTLNFSSGVNIIHGETDSGKSCIVRAIKWIFFGEPKGDVVRKEGTKKTSVKAIFEDGITVEKIKSASVNAYILKVGEEVKRFDAVGKTIPEEILKVLKSRTIRVNDEEIILNIANQISLPFLLDKSGTFRMKLFNQLTGNDIIDKVFQSLNKDILHINKEEKIRKEQLILTKKLLEGVIKNKDKKKKLYDLFITQYNEVKEKLVTYEKIHDYSHMLNFTNAELEIVNDRLNNIKIIDEKQLVNLDISIKRLERLNELLHKIKIVKKELLDIEEQLKKTIVPEINIKELREKIEKLTKYQKYITQLNNIETIDDKLTTQIFDITVELKEDSKKYKEVLKKIKVCPFYQKECPLNKEIK